MVSSRGHVGVGRNAFPIDDMRSIDIGGHTIKVVIDPTIEEYGLFDLDRMTITLRNYDEVTLRHELVHAALRIGGVAFCDNFPEEAVVRCMDHLFFPAWENRNKNQ